MVPTQKYKQFLTEFVRKHMVILGPNISLDTAARIPGCQVDNTGEVVGLTGAPLLVLQDLSMAYQQLCAPITLLNLHLLLDIYEDIKAEYNQPLPHVKLTCALTESQL